MSAFDEKLYRAFLVEYHCTTAGTLESDLGCGEPGYSEALNADLFKRYGTADWKVAYQNAAAWHRKEFEALCNGQSWSEVWDAVGGFDAHDRSVDHWISDNLRLGDDPKIFPGGAPKTEGRVCTCPTMLLVQAGCKCGGE